jgi:hypothetical protein
MTQLPLGAVYVPPVTNAPPYYLSASPDGNQKLLDAWTGTPTTLYGCTFYLSTQGGSGAWHSGDLGATIDSLLNLAQQDSLNMVRVTDFFNGSDATQVWDDPQVWTNIDYLVSACQLRGMYVLMDVASWGAYMTSQGGTGGNDPTVAANWTAKLQALGAHYINAKNICWYSIRGEPSVPTDATTTTALVNFYDSVTTTLYTADPNHLITAGGLLNMQQNPSLSWWQQIFSLAHNNVCSYKVYSQDDLDYINFIGRYVSALGKPLSNQEFGGEQVLGDSVYSGTPYNNIALSRADYFRQVYRRGWQVTTSSFIFWNLGFQVNPTGFDVSPDISPAAWMVIGEAASGQSPASITIGSATLDDTLYVSGDSLSIDLAINQRSKADFTLLDTLGAQHFDQGEPLIIVDDFNQRLFGGVITDAVETQPAPTDEENGALLRHVLNYADWHYLADKRAFPYSNANVSLQQVIRDMMSQVLLAEGVVAAFGDNYLSPNQSLGADEDLQGFVAINNAVISQDAPMPGALHGSLKVVCSGAQAFQAVEVRIPVGVIPGINGAQITISAYARASSGTPTLRMFVQGASAALGSTTTKTLSTTRTRYTWTATMPNPVTGGFLAIRFDTGTPAQAVTFWLDSLQIEKAGSASAWQLGGEATVQTGPTIQEITSNYSSCAENLDSLSQAADFTWQIDAYKVLWCGAPGQLVAPWSAAMIDMERGSIEVERANQQYRNRQYLLGAHAQTSTQIETRIGDGTNQSFTMSYELATTPTVEVKIGAGSFVAKTVGIGGVDSARDWYWNAGKNIVFQDTAGTKLTSSDTLRVTYVGQFPVVVLSTNDTEIAAQLAREAGVGTGYVDAVASDSTLKTIAGAYQAAGGYLSRYGQLGKKAKFRTLRGGLMPGQLLSVDLPAHDINNAQMLVESVRLAYTGFYFYYDITAVEGPVNQTWPQYFEALATKSGQTVDKINLGSGSNLALLQSFTASKSPSASFTATVNACMFPSATAYPSTSTYPC